MPFQCYELLRKGGFIEALEILYSYPNHETRLSTFLKEIRDVWQSYPNRYFRVQKSLVRCGLITFRLDDTFAKLIGLTPKGERVFELIEQLNTSIISK